MREILLSLLPNTVECRMIRSRRPAMTSMLYHQGNRVFQDEFGSRRLADRLPKRLRINGNARIDRDDPLLPDTVGAQLIVRIKVDVIFPNCPRYIPSMTLTEPSIYVPHAGVAPVEPAWKGFDAFRDVVPPRAG